MGALDKATWFKSSHSGVSNGCVEVAYTTRVVGVRDTKNRVAGRLELDRAAFANFLSALK
ncbi:uncharacterized protein DUF397 [Tamaricihabitans halophyticus]|uniref:Uncharacterized protein DUF397 n=1 Tax=Tamaricihabitans halophyticus TaxID=1262583 RepID=A0A4R2QWT0_9PSEU|nr:DUF397 domain-containing protein [Tamaricihabitans halophyticus]TCP53599.1 uncharacterized protein DUF397 [Tamaricihabitans halophyticus]